MLNVCPAMIFKSIRWRLQIWYGLILIVVLAGFGVTAYRLESGRQFRRIDGELHQRVNALANVRNPPPRGRGPNEPASFDGPDFDRPPRPRRGPPFDGDPRGRPVALEEFHLPPRMAHLFDETDTNGFYYVVWSAEGKELARSTNAPPNMSRFPAGEANLRESPLYRVNTVTGPPRMRREPPVSRMRDEFREVSVVAPRGEIFLAGRTITAEMKEIRGIAWRLTGVGGGILLAGLLGGWWLVGRAIRPVEQISAAAVKISAGDLSQRINVADTENELGRLASVLNSTFARLDAAFAQQQQFTSDAAHELRTPVSVMLTQTQTALTRERSAAEYRDTVEACQRSAQRMRRLIESLLELARLDAGQETIKRARFDLGRVAADCVEQVRPLAVGRKIEIRSELFELESHGDSGRIAL
jgi:two-component system, OmpR family, sensor kinase